METDLSLCAKLRLMTYTTHVLCNRLYYASTKYDMKLIGLLCLHQVKKINNYIGNRSPCHRIIVPTLKWMSACPSVVEFNDKLLVMMTLMYMLLQ